MLATFLGAGARLGILRVVLVGEPTDAFRDLAACILEAADSLTPARRVLLLARGQNLNLQKASLGSSVRAGLGRLEALRPCPAGTGVYVRGGQVQTTFHEPWSVAMADPVPLTWKLDQQLPDWSPFSFPCRPRAWRWPPAQRVPWRQTTTAAWARCSGPEAGLIWASMAPLSDANGRSEAYSQSPMQA